MRVLEDTLAEPLLLQSLPMAAPADNSLRSHWATLQLTGGKKDKLRPGDIVGALTRDNQISQEQLGKIKSKATGALLPSIKLWQSARSRSLIKTESKANASALVFSKTLIKKAASVKRPFAIYEEASL
ncbi:hypothetical protein CWE15_07415 [Aliidiomarina taiwanensis]|uniref:DEAD box helicase DbpA/CsdA RNA-binding domain-containing protein n=1 Tax=Aliidiomarina taiwanensis TaxID=946228 RepID=A0A432X247_9GAMM|nr:DbpA RNA binding domain-containing protein [Aliidiomarina taiwanensis]RUO40564.1 hypothetical protein CWE15_07415 [Aliidiomarina taiwanensis]